jgi:acyl-CoA thioester hydrolase
MTEYESKKPFELIIPVQPEHIDMLNHVNNLVYVGWIQEVAIAHWEKYADEALRAAIAWVVIRHEIDYHSSAKLGDTVIVRTWIGAAIKNKFERHTEIIRQSDNKLLIKARSLWCPIDIKSMRPVRVAPEIYQRWTTNES